MKVARTQLNQIGIQGWKIGHGRNECAEEAASNSLIIETLGFDLKE